MSDKPKKGPFFKINVVRLAINRNRNVSDFTTQAVETCYTLSLNILEPLQIF